MERTREISYQWKNPPHKWLYTTNWSVLKRIHLSTIILMEHSYAPSNNMYVIIIKEKRGREFERHQGVGYTWKGLEGEKVSGK